MMKRNSVIALVGALSVIIGTGVVLIGPAVVPAQGATAGIVSGPPGGGPRMARSFSDEFDGALDPRWIFAFYNPDTEQPTVTKRTLWSNKERQVFFDPAFLGLGIRPHVLEKTMLRIVARPLDPAALGAVRAAVAKQPGKIANSAIRDVTYSSGMISTRNRYSQKYGYFEMRARWSAGRGLWPAFWLLPDGGGWPPEIDVMEAHGDKPTAAFQSIHSTTAGDSTSRVRLPGGTGQEFHTYGAMWTARTIDYYIDGVKTASRPTPSDMHVPMYILASFAIGGAWPGDPDGTTPVPAYMDIDFIRAWRFVDAP